MGAEDRFTFRQVKDDRVMIYSDGRHVTTLAGRAAVQFLERVARDPDAAAGLMARATGNYKRGNERGR